MQQHHRETLDAATEKLQADENVVAMLLSGSVARGWERPGSDVDLIIVKTDAAFQRHLDDFDLTYADEEIATYDGGYVDGKLVNKAFLLEVRDRGSEVAKSAFMKAQVIFSRDPEIPALVEQIAQYPEEQRAAKIRTFVSQTMLWQWYVTQAEVRDDRYLMLQSVTELVLFGSRLMLAHNRLLFPFHKWLRRQLQEAESLPPDHFRLMDNVLENPSVQTADAYAEAVLSFQDWKLSVREAVDLYTTEREWNWRSGYPPIHDW